MLPKIPTWPLFLSAISYAPSSQASPTPHDSSYKMIDFKDLVSTNWEPQLAGKNIDSV